MAIALGKLPQLRSRISEDSGKLCTLRSATYSLSLDLSFPEESTTGLDPFMVNGMCFRRISPFSQP